MSVNGSVARDPHKHVVTHFHWVKVNKEDKIQAGDDALSAKWYPLQDIIGRRKIAFDHMDGIETFLKKRKLGHFEK